MPHASTIVTAAGGPTLSRIVAGAWRMGDWNFGVDERVRWIEGCLDLGITTFDHADIYGNYGCEALFGEALAAAPQLRDRMQIVTKCGIRMVSSARPEHRLGHYDTSAAHVERSVDNSLAALRTDRLDVLLIHRPDTLMDADALAECFGRLRTAGKVRHFGVSNFTPSQFALLHRRIGLVTNQIEASPLHIAPFYDGTLDQAQDLGVAPMIWSALAGGRLFTGNDVDAQRVRAVLERIAHERGLSVTTLVYAWLLRHPARLIPLTGSRRLDAMREAVAALDVEIDAQAWYEIWVAGNGAPCP
ncbi:aldo/keto reductase [Scleromatobacter humisilvae]|uniref:Aldo/keto reductase n=1 Tax=Scleromatobacter humisilvae TaxID=2897159 RepID=A0A9X1YSR7_9BURK|nr:aldo/keto reductase [Scleromatobacter humisilvae]MCK9688806.1 aldo/keto reductase [Scleromatobacter humisilvae]